MAKEISNFRQGDTKTLKIDYGAGVSIVGYKFWFTLKSDFGGPIVAQSITTAGDNAAGPDNPDDPANGVAFIQMSSVVSKAVVPGKYFWDVQRLKPNTTPPDILTIKPSNKYIKDKVEVLPQVTLAEA